MLPEDMAPSPKLPSFVLESDSGELEVDEAAFRAYRDEQHALHNMAAAQRLVGTSIQDSFDWINQHMRNNALNCKSRSQAYHPVRENSAGGGHGFTAYRPGDQPGWPPSQLQLYATSSLVYHAKFCGCNGFLAKRLVQLMMERAIRRTNAEHDWFEVEVGWTDDHNNLIS